MALVKPPVEIKNTPRVEVTARDAIAGAKISPKTNFLTRIKDFIKARSINKGINALEKGMVYGEVQEKELNAVASLLQPDFKNYYADVKKSFQQKINEKEFAKEASKQAINDFVKLGAKQIPTKIEVLPGGEVKILEQTSALGEFMNAKGTPRERLNAAFNVIQKYEKLKRGNLEVIEGAPKFNSELDNLVNITENTISNWKQQIEAKRMTGGNTEWANATREFRNVDNNLVKFKNSIEAFKRGELDVNRLEIYGFSKVPGLENVMKEVMEKASLQQAIRSELGIGKIKQGITTKDVAGIDPNIKAKLNEIVNVLKAKKANPQATKLGQGYLFEGLPGTAKTLSANAVANEAGAEFIEYSPLTSKWMGESQQNLLAFEQKVMSKLKEGPVVLFLDEIDKIPGFGKNVSEGEGSTIAEMQKIWLHFTEKFIQNGGVLIGATNYADAIEPAAKSRFGVGEGNVGALTFKALETPQQRADVLKSVLKVEKNNMGYKIHDSLKDDNILLNLAQEMPNTIVGRDIKTIVRDSLFSSFAERPTSELEIRSEDILKVLKRMRQPQKQA